MNVTRYDYSSEVGDFYPLDDGPLVMFKDLPQNPSFWMAKGCSDLFLLKTEAVTKAAEIDPDSVVVYPVYIGKPMDIDI